jgi:histidinol phosphatase-like PHP family hydrolase
LISPGPAFGALDLHVHTDLSDGDLTPERVAELAAARGVQIGIADHVSSRNPTRFVADPAQVEEYLEALARLPLFRGGEFCWLDDLWRELPGDTLARFDYRIGSNHGFLLPDGTVASPWWKTLPPPWDTDPDAVMDALVDGLCALVGTMPVQIVAHSTLTPPALLELEGDTDAWWTAPREDRFVEALVESGVALEISARYRLPHDRMLRKALAAGARFSLGSDAHHEEQVGRLEWAVETARRVGVTARELFVPDSASPAVGLGSCTRGRIP